MAAQICLFCLYKNARPICVQNSFLIFMARYCNNKYDCPKEIVSHIKTTNKTTSPRLRWKRFLSNLTPRKPPKPKYKSMDKCLSMSLGPPSISKLFFTKINAQRFSSMSELHNSRLDYYKNNNKTKYPALAPKILQDTGLKLDLAKLNQNMSFVRIKSKSLNYTKPKNRPDYLSKSVSKWTFKMLSKYIDLEEHVEELVIDTAGTDFSLEMVDIIQETVNMLHTSYRKPSLHHVLSTESDVRIFLTALLKNLCQKLGVSLRTEEKVQQVHLPTCKFDFLFLTHDGKPIGCMEAKTAYTLTSRAFAQAVVQLLLLQQLAWQHDVDISSVPLFNVLSDGRRFVLMQVKGEKLFLEYESRSRNDVLKVRTSEVMEALFNLIKETLDYKP